MVAPLVTAFKRAMCSDLLHIAHCVRQLVKGGVVHAYFRKFNFSIED